MCWDALCEEIRSTKARKQEITPPHPFAKNARGGASVREIRYRFTGSEHQRCRTHPPPPEFFHCSCNIQSLPPKTTLNFAWAATPAGEHPLPVIQVEVVIPKLKLHLSESSWPLESNQAFRSGSVMASNCSCAKTLIIPSAPPTPIAGLLGPVV